ncbi:MAG: tetratricopeptide repeat protein [Cyanobacteria bacterium TGS_CYA1]|nr:tetratricopeptide repeat protein [Cyanobacteria bacterium TGS_CYA1]
MLRFRFALGISLLVSFSAAPVMASDVSSIDQEASSFFIKNEMTKALDVLNKGIKEHPTSSKLYQFRAELHFHKSNYVFALQDAEKALANAKDDSSKSKALLSKAKAEQYLGKPKEAESDYLRSIKLDPEDLFAYAAYGQFLSSQTRNTEAIKALRKSLDLAKNKDVVGFERFERLLEKLTILETEKIYNQADKLADAKRYEEAIAILTKGLVEYPDALNFQFLRGSAFYFQKKYRESIEDENKVIEQLRSNPSVVAAYLYKALAEAGLNENEKADSDFKKCLEIQPELDIIHFQYGKFLLNNGYKAKAIEHLDNALRKPSGKMPAEHQAELKQMREKLK